MTSESNQHVHPNARQVGDTLAFEGFYINYLSPNTTLSKHAMRVSEAKKEKYWQLS
jgi:hypothetical protein